MQYAKFEAQQHAPDKELENQVSVPTINDYNDSRGVSQLVDTFLSAHTVGKDEEQAKAMLLVSTSKTLNNKTQSAPSCLLPIISNGTLVAHANHSRPCLQESGIY